MRLKIDGPFFNPRYGLKIGRRDRDIFRFEGGIGVGKGVGELIKSISLP